MRVLIVEDEVRLAAALARGLQREGMVVDVAHDGRTGYDKARAGEYDVVVLDRDVPGMSGDDLCVVLTARKDRTRVIMVTTAQDIRLDPARHTVTRGRRRVALTRKEFGLLEALLAARGRVVGAPELRATVWATSRNPTGNVVRQTIKNLRDKLGAPDVIRTQIGDGYAIDVA